MRKTFLIILLCLSVLGVSAFAEEWSKTYRVGDKPTLRTRTEQQPSSTTGTQTGGQQPQSGGDDSDPDRPVLKKRTDDSPN